MYTKIYMNISLYCKRNNKEAIILEVIYLPHLLSVCEQKIGFHTMINHKVTLDLCLNNTIVINLKHVDCYLLQLIHQKCNGENIRLLSFSTTVQQVRWVLTWYKLPQPDVLVRVFRVGQLAGTDSWLARFAAGRSLKSYYFPFLVLRNSHFHIPWYRKWVESIQCAGIEDSVNFPPPPVTRPSTLLTQHPTRWFSPITAVSSQSALVPDLSYAALPELSLALVPLYQHLQLSQFRMPCIQPVGVATLMNPHCSAVDYSSCQKSVPTICIKLTHRFRLAHLEHTL